MSVYFSVYPSTVDSFITHELRFFLLLPSPPKASEELPKIALESAGSPTYTFFFPRRSGSLASPPSLLSLFLQKSSAPGLEHKPENSAGSLQDFSKSKAVGQMLSRESRLYREGP
jgi:hypothetical protein